MAGNVLLIGPEMDSSIQAYLAGQGITSTIISGNDLATTDLSGYTAIWIGWFGTVTNPNGDLAAILAAFVTGGGNILVEPYTNVTQFLPNGLDFTSETESHGDDVIVVNSAGDLLNGLTSADLSNWYSSYHEVYGLNDYNEFILVAENTSGSDITLIQTYGLGYVIITGQDPSWHIKNGNWHGADGDNSPQLAFVINALTLEPSSEPATAQDDAFTSSELSVVTGNLFADNGSGADSDPDGPALAISAVNGSTANVGNQITLASGALLTVNADGTFSYNPNGAFEYTPTVASGASNTPSSDSFTYTLAGGGTATVALTITGADNNDTLLGTAGNDTLEGGLGNDTLDGGGGIDTASYANASGGVQVFLTATGGSASGADGNDTLVGIENLTGSAYNDFLTGNVGANLLSGGDGHDQLRGNDGNDALYGGNGDDFLSGGMGDDLLDGGTGFDRVSYLAGATAAVTIDLNIQGIAQNTIGAGMDTLIGIEHASGTIYNDTLTGNAGDNWLWGGSNGSGVTGNDLINAGAGNDLVTVGTGNHTLNGDAGVDTLSLLGNTTDITAAGITFSLALQGAAQDTEQGMMNASGFENVSGSIHDDVITGDGADNVLAGDTGNDSLLGGAGNDTLYGDGRVAMDSHGTGGSGPITTFADVSVTFGGVAGNDLLEGGLGNDIINGGGGIDTASYANAAGGVTAFLYRLGDGNGEAFGADGNDTLVGIENLTGSAFNDNLGGNNLANVLDGGDGHDGLRGNDGNDILLGGNGDDFLAGGLGDDLLDGGAGFDRVSFYSDATAGVTVNLNLQGIAQNTGQGMDTLIGIEHVSGSFYADTLIGDGGDNWLWGSAATLTNGTVATTNNDTLIGGGGNDLLEVGIGNHSLTGGTGIDTVAFTENGAPETGIAVSLALQGAAQVTGNGSWTLTGIENLSGGVANDTLTGDGNANVLAGDFGNDVLSGGGGNDTLYGDGQIGTDNHGLGTSGPITTFADVSVTFGGVAGNDILEGGLGNDTLNGGGGIDTASYANAAGGVQVTLFNNSTGNGSSTGADGNDVLNGIENITGSAFNDTLTGNTLANALSGGDGNDTLRGRGGDDTLLAGNGNDFLNGGLGDDVINGGAGYDRAAFYTDATAGVTVNLNLQGVAQNTGQGMDTLIGIESLSGTLFNDSLTGDAGDNWLWGSPATLDDGSISATNNDMLDGGDGNDILWVGIGTHTIIGGSGIDTLRFTENGQVALEAGLTVTLASQGVAQTTGNGSWTLTGIENLSGGNGNDNLTGDGNANVLAGSVGADFLSGGGGDDILLGDGDLDFDANNVIINVLDNGVAGNDILEGGLGNDTINGGGGIDTASYANASGAVSVALSASGGSASGADGNDTLVSIENITGSAYNDTLTGNAGANLLSGGGGHDLLRGNDGNDTLYGGNGDDFLSGGMGDDLLDGGAGFDRVSFLAGATAGVTVNLNIQGVAQNTIGAGMDTLIGIEHVSGTIFNDTLTGDGGDNWLWGGSDGSGVTGNDVIDAGGGNDLVEVGTGTHTLAGGIGNDTLSMLGNTTDITAAGITFSLALQGAAQDTEQGMMNASGFENVSGSIHDDVITGDVGANILLGDTGSDTLNGGDGNDFLYGDGRMSIDSHGIGGSGPITLYGDVERDLGSGTGLDGNDILNGGKGDDRIYGGRGDDVMSGGPGRDQFVIEAQSGDDRITDFAHVDRIVFDATSGVDAFSDLIFTAVGKNTLISWGTDDSLLVEGYRPRDLTAADFTFATTAAASSAQVIDSSGHGSTSHGSALSASYAAMELAASDYLVG